MAEVYATQHSGSLIDGLASDLLLERADDEAPTRPNGWVIDENWVRRSFIVGIDGLNKPLLDRIDRQNRIFSTANLKFTDSSLGGNTVINPPPQFTRYADVPVRSVLPGTPEQVSLGIQKDSIGMGRYYSEAIDDNNQVIHLRFGVAQFNSLTQFFRGFYSSEAGRLARTGRFTDGFINSFLRFGATVLATALIPLVIIPVAILMFGSAARFFLGWPTSKFYTLKPSMELYWNAVTSMVNQIGANQGVITYMDDDQVKSIMGEEHKFTNRELSIFSTMMDGAITDRGAIDVFKIANRAKRLEMRFEQMRADAFENAANSGGDGDLERFFGVVRDSYTNDSLSGAPALTSANQKSPSLESYLARYLSLGQKFSQATDGNGDTALETDIKAPATVTDADPKAPYAPKQEDDNFFQYLLANLGDGSDWASFRVDYTGPVSESFSNTTAPSSLQQKINGLSSSTHDIRMNYGGALAAMPVIGEVIEGVKTVLGTVAATLHLEGLAAMAGSAFVDIPEHWESSVAQLPKANYTLTLISPYGNPISQMFNIYIPLAMLLAGALPLSTGKQSHTSPFLCEIHDRGRVMSRLAIIDSLSITRGTSNLGFNNEGQPMAVDVTFSIKDLSSIMALPIQPGFSEQPFAGLFDGDNAFSDYLMALSAMRLGDTIYKVPMLKYQMKRSIANLDVFTSKASIASYVASMPGVQALSGIMRGTNRE